ncbi:hypothetical protein AGR2A_Lc20030 [Agrobacterium genomosp. 2 str. CFBP 5494]|uniref:Uncharacterized protein n=1 Tax=Agrobacterium genomosp. 2 str. CFBP 5494 TaxID=1183436 RepID=A0A9W5F408_9HYPH|nr:hypothetical protein AGR2A_Lc20030 [Agrobacterium genomosp. 2 str. CFBP 5494]
MSVAHNNAKRATGVFLSIVRTISSCSFGSRWAKRYATAF